MDRVNQILHNTKFQKYINELENLEKERQFCLHNIEHSLDVARIAYINILENKLSFSKEVVYVIALLHDLGRVLEYKQNIEHHEGSVIIAKEILEDISFSKEEKAQIITSISNHRDESTDTLSSIIYISDKISRNCFKCKMQSECYWSDDKKNFNIKL